MMRGGNATIGTWLQFPSADVAEVMGASGYDWVAVDMEHGAFTRAILPDVFRAIERGGSTPFARIAQAELRPIKDALDSGAQGLVFPMIESREQLDRAIALQEKAMAEEDRIGFFLSDNLMHHMIFSIACRSTVWSWLEETNADLERFRWLRAATQVLDNQDIVNEHKQIRRAIAGRDPIEASFLVSKHLHMMFRKQTEVLDQFPEHFETSKLR